MNGFWFLCAFLLFITLDGSRTLRLSQDATRKSQKDFRYVICGNDLSPRPGPYAVRNISVLMDESSFEPDTLKLLFGLLNKRFPEPVAFICTVFTSLDQINTPEEADKPKHSASNETSKEDHHHRAILIRTEKNEIIRYTVAPGNYSLETIVLKGIDPMSSPR